MARPMKPKSLLPLLLPTSLVAFDSHARADDGEDGDHSQDCQIDGTEELEAAIVFTATTNAPAGASGAATLQADDEDGNESATLDLETQGLLPGDYTVSA